MTNLKFHFEVKCTMLNPTANDFLQKFTIQNQTCTKPSIYVNFHLIQECMHYHNQLSDAEECQRSSGDSIQDIIDENQQIKQSPCHCTSMDIEEIFEVDLSKLHSGRIAIKEARQFVDIW